MTAFADAVLRVPDLCRLTRTTLALLTATALVFHTVVPLAPPRLPTAAGMVDTGNTIGPGVHTASTNALTNQHAAMPSLHVGWATVVAVMLIRASRRPDAGPVVVTGAAGGVGSVAIALLAALGYEVHASTGRTGEADYLRALGATQIIARTELAAPSQSPLASERWAGGVDTVGSHTLVNVLSQIRYGGVVANCGLAPGLDLVGSIAPFILRSVTLAGIDSVNAPATKRDEAWDLLAEYLDERLLAGMRLSLRDSVCERRPHKGALSPHGYGGTTRGRSCGPTR